MFEVALKLSSEANVFSITENSLRSRLGEEISSSHLSIALNNSELYLKCCSEKKLSRICLELIRHRVRFLPNRNHSNINSRVKGSEEERSNKKENSTGFDSVCTLSNPKSRRNSFIRNKWSSKMIFFRSPLKQVSAQKCEHLCHCPRSSSFDFKFISNESN